MMNEVAMNLFTPDVVFALLLSARLHLGLGGAALRVVSSGQVPLPLLHHRTKMLVNDLLFRKS